MSKGLGQKIAIKFTEDLVGDVSGNENAFTIIGQEYQYVNGPLVNTIYDIENVERYGVIPLWSLGSSLQLSKTLIEGEDELWDGTFTERYLGGCDFINNSSTRTTNAIPVIEGEQYTFSGGNRCRLRWNDLSGNCIGSSDEGNTASPITKTAPINAKSVYYYYASSDFSIPPSVMGPTLIEEFEATTIVATEEILLIGQNRVNWIEDKPIGTDITIEYTTGAEQGEWVELSNGDVVTSDTNIWLKATLETTDTSVTPTLQDLWIEEPDAPQDKIRIVMDEFSRFPTVEGNLTVEYDASVGNLAGRGGFVESFIEVFTPTDLAPEPNPGIQDTISVAPAELIINHIPISYHNRYEEETITVAPAELTVNLIYVGVINP